MSTHSSARNLFPPLDNPELTIRRRSRAGPTLLNDFEMVVEGNGDTPVPDLRTMEELCQPSLNGRGVPIAPITIQATNFGLKNEMIQQVQNSCQFHGLPGDDANKHLDKFLNVTQSIKVNGVTDDALRLYLFPHSLTHHATAWFDRFLRNSINTFEQMAKMYLGKYFPPSMVTKLRNEITHFRQCPDESLFEAWECYKLSIDRCPNHNMFPVTQIDTFYNGLTLRHRDTINAAAGGTFMKSAEMAKINKNLIRVPQVNQQLKAVTPNCEIFGGPHSYNDCPAIVGQTQNVYAARAYNQGCNSYQPQGSGTLPSNTITNPNEDLKGITTHSGIAYQGPMISTTSSSLPKVVEHETEPVVAPVSASKPNQKPLIPYPSRLHDQKLRDKANDQKGKFFQIFQDLNFNISFADALILMPKFGPTIKTLLTNKDKLSELARTPLNEHCSAVLLKKLPEKLRDPGKVAEDVFVKVGTFHFPSDFVVFDFDADPRVLLILRRSFLKTERALIDVLEGELTLRVGKEAITFNLDQTSRYSANYNDVTANRIDVIDMASKNDKSPIDEPPKVELKDLPLHLEYAFLEGDDKLPVINAKYLDDEEKTTLIKAFWVMQCTGYVPKVYDGHLSRYDQKNDGSLHGRLLSFGISFETCLSHLEKMLKQCEDTNLCLNWEKSHFIIKEGIVLGHNISKNEIEVDKAKVNVIAKLPYSTIVKGIRSFLGHAGF
nr:reverse transcriptase domain-containing protein [Tanacetum cinerariifolium]